MAEDEALARFKELLASTSNASFEDVPIPAVAASCDLLIKQLSPTLAECFRLCAIPHQFDSEILKILVPDANAAQIQEFCHRFAQFSIVSRRGNALALHDSARTYLFRSWLRERGPRFQTVSERLRDYFRAQAAGKDAQCGDLYLHQEVFHSIGADQVQGIARFERLCRQHRRDRRLSDCASLIKLVHEYDQVLIESSRGVLAYHEAKLAADRNDWDDSEKHLVMVLENPAVGDEIRLKAHIRLGMAFLNRRDWDHAIQTFETAKALALKVHGESAQLPLILHDISVAHRNRGDRVRSQQYLNESIHLAQRGEYIGCLATAYNSLGTLHRSYKEYKEAIRAYEKSLEYLERNGDRFGRAAVLNNLGGVYFDLADWGKSQSYYEQSLRVSLEGADTLGQSRTMTNLIQVYRNQNQTEKAIETGRLAISWLSELHDYHNAAIAALRIARVHRSLNRKEDAVKSYTIAEALFERAGSSNDVKTAAAERSAMLKAAGLPWWMWVVIVVGLLFFLLVILMIVIISASR